MDVDFVQQEEDPKDEHLGAIYSTKSCTSNII